MDEVDEDREVHEQQGFGDGDREMRHEDAAMAADGYRTEGERGVDEGADEDAECDLVPDVPDEVAHHAGTELLGRQGEGQDRDREHDADHGDHRGGDGDEHLATSVCAFCSHPERQREVPVIGRPVDFETDREQHTGDHDEDGGHQPEGRAERLPPPAGKLPPRLPRPRAVHRCPRRASAPSRVPNGCGKRIGHWVSPMFADQSSRHAFDSKEYCSCGPLFCSARVSRRSRWSGRWRG